MAINFFSSLHVHPDTIRAMVVCCCSSSSRVTSQLLKDCTVKSFVPSSPHYKRVLHLGEAVLAAVERSSYNILRIAGFRMASDVAAAMQQVDGLISSIDRGSTGAHLLSAQKRKKKECGMKFMGPAFATF
ncbi:hypothetical protein Aduo_018423 [Ancylostoma duodenale]